MSATPRRHSFALATLVIAVITGLLGWSQPAHTAGDGGKDGGKGKYTPPLGATFSNPLNGHGRDILREVFDAVYASPKGSTIRFVVWNYDEPRLTNALIAAKKRGVQVQVVVADTVDSRSFYTLRNFLAQNPDDKSFAKACRGACRSARAVMHAKVFLFSKAGTRRHLSMFGSSNLTLAAGSRQWNDQVTTDNKELYDFLVQTFDEYAADTPVSTGRDEFDNGRFKVSLFPVVDNPVAKAFDKVACHSPEQKERTTIRIAIAGWFDEFGMTIAQQVRSLWNRGCDVKIVTTLIGRKLNRVLKRRSGRGPIPIRTIVVDRGDDGIAERYLHMKAVSIQGVYDGTPNTHVVFSGSPNWSNDARNADEMFVVIRNAKTLARDYRRFIDYLFGSAVASTTPFVPAKDPERQAFRVRLERAGLELD